MRGLVRRAARCAILMILTASIAGCTTIDGPRATMTDFGPAPAPRNDYHSKGTPATTLYALLSTRWDASSKDVPNGPKAMDLERAGIAVVKQNCADYFDSAGRTERYLLFGRDITTFAGAVGTAALVAAHASSGAVGGFALGATNLIAVNDTLRKQLTYGADFTSSARTMVESNLATFEAAILAKDETKYDFLAAVSDLHDFQTICTPATIIANMNAAIATKKFNAIVVQTAGAPATTTTTTKSAGAAPASTDQTQARQLKAQLSDLQARNLLPGSQLGSTIQQLSDSLDTLAKGQAVQHVEPAPAAAPDAQHVPAQAKIILRPSDD